VSADGAGQFAAHADRSLSTGVGDSLGVDHETPANLPLKKRGRALDHFGQRNFFCEQIEFLDVELAARAPPCFDPVGARTQPVNKTPAFASN
jgi:hypothetical protein